MDQYFGFQLPQKWAVYQTTTIHFPLGTKHHLFQNGIYECNWLITVHNYPPNNVNFVEEKKSRKNDRKPILVTQSSNKSHTTPSRGTPPQHWSYKKIKEKHRKMTEKLIWRNNHQVEEHHHNIEVTRISKRNTRKLQKTNMEKQTPAWIHSK